MPNDLAILGHRFLFNTRLLAAETDGFADADWRWKPASGGNPALWILGHVTHFRRTMRRRLGESVVDAPWEATFARGSKPAAEFGIAPAELAADFAGSGMALVDALPRLAPAALAAPWGRPFPDGADTLGGGLSFLYFHETYHLGQIGYLRRLLGKPGIA